MSPTCCHLAARDRPLCRCSRSALPRVRARWRGCVVNVPGPVVLAFMDSLAQRRRWAVVERSVAGAGHVVTCYVRAQRRASRPRSQRGGAGDGHQGFSRDAHPRSPGGRAAHPRGKPGAGGAAQDRRDRPREHRLAFDRAPADEQGQVHRGSFSDGPIAGQHRAVGLPMRRGARTWDRQRFISSSLGF